mgnify:CR=1 FL=1
MTDQKYKDLMNGGWSYPKKESTDPEEVKKVVDKYLTDNKIDSETIDKKITDGVSKIVADAPEDFDTLKEMSDWISQHSDSAAAMNSDILDNKSGIESLQKDKANATDVEALQTEVSNNKNAISEINDNLDVFGKCIHQKGEFYQGCGINNGVIISESNYDCYWMIPIEPNTNYYNTMNRAFYWYNENKTFIGSTPNGLSPSNARYLSIDFKAGADVKVYKGLYADNISHINDSLSALGKCKNLLKLKVGNMTQTGITLEVDNGKIHVYGTSTENTFIHIADITLKKGVSYKLCSQPFTKGNVYLLNGTIYQNNVYTPSKDEPQTVVLNIWNGQTVDFYITPMITTNINATADDFVPYTGDGDTLTADVAKMKNDVDNKYIDTFYLGSNSSTTFDISERVKIGYPIMIMAYPIDDQPGIWNYVGVIMPSSLDIHIVTLNSSNIEITMDNNYIITVKNTNADWGTHFKMRLI